MNEEKKEFTSWWMLALGLTLLSVIALTVVGTGLNYVGILGSTVVEREVFENSYQYTAAQKQKMAIIKAQIAEIESQLLNKDLDPQVKSNLEAQLAGLRIQLSAAQEMSR